MANYAARQHKRLTWYWECSSCLPTQSFRRPGLCCPVCLPSVRLRIIFRGLRCFCCVVFILESSVVQARRVLVLYVVRLALIRYRSIIWSRIGVLGGVVARFSIGCVVGIGQFCSSRKGGSEAGWSSCRREQCSEIHRWQRARSCLLECYLQSGFLLSIDG